jgi:hypothetical protein
MAENMERGGVGGGATQHNFTLADLISNVSEVKEEREGMFRIRHDRLF